jgi:thiamine pyrophosphate-dependent acetolactate synthase large subunit-like protein
MKFAELKANNLCRKEQHPQESQQPVHEATYEVFRSPGMTTIFGHPGSNELPFLDRMPADFRYILAQQDGASLAMADGYAQATGQPLVHYVRYRVFTLS